MQRKRANLSLLLSIAAFAMLTMAQWLHSPLHHLAEFAANIEEVQAEHSCSHAHDHTHHQVDHSHESVDHKDGHKDCPSHPHSEDECAICLFVLENLGQIESSVDLIGYESVENFQESFAPLFYGFEHDAFLIRGPPIA